MMMDSHNVAKFPTLKRKAFEYADRLSELDSKRPYRNNVNKFRDQEMDRDYAWLLNYMLKTDKQTTINRSQNVDKKVIDYENKNENEDMNDKDPQYCLFLENLVQNGKSYKLKISKHDEPLRFLHYEEPENSVGDDDDNPPTYGEFANQSPQEMQIDQRDKQMLFGKEGEISTINEVSRTKKINQHKSVIEPYLGTVDPCYLLFLKGYNPSNSNFFHEGNKVEYEKKDNQPVLAEKQPVLAEKQPVFAEKCLSLKEKLMRILRKPFSKKEYKVLKAYVEKKKPICRLLPLRQRSISSALEGMTKSLLDDSPGSFRRRYEAAKEERSIAKALNLLRMFRFWLEHVPNEDIFEPWLDKEIREVLPPHRT